ncbi:MAG: glutathione synthase [Gammaproteobacteria bacterium RIFCSPLOWO2_02_FULL_38_11]|nr:MAG: glutathione synthase [Gammaproteobacteria bacterium RIFCSPHIGHO2_02_FULL_38_33]OGT24082.1 MAG: glutathione synthase [Gammaproteobacteria bacterium RIFCSPHIGHO2_12_38_15]OGT66723.1 MAG: glutathione synthase [Gammaproteobacteria bacterium RIFCSPLOWO2_02_FULL_38_11]OGT77359.1 MAG: glutathione synthase [Gammaproteobacteria bacterium RIFCSPLOWO2_12_FULL_38_14]
MKLAVLIDPLESLHREKDTTLGLLLAAQKNKIAIFYMTLEDIFLYNNTPFSYSKKIHLTMHKKKWFEIQKTESLPLSFFDFIFMRKDPPVNSAYIHATQILEFAENQGVRVINKPQSLREYNEKMMIHFFEDLYPETLISARQEDIKNFINTNKTIICKPLDEMGGKNIFKITKTDLNKNVILETLTNYGKQHIVCQRYLPEIKHGDKRILMVKGKPLPYALARLPKAGETRANLASGGMAKGLKLSKRDHEICEILSPFLREKELDFVGLDVIGTYLTEINITSPTCVRELEKIYKINFSKQILDALIL